MDGAVNGDPFFEVDDAPYAPPATAVKVKLIRLDNGPYQLWQRGVEYKGRYNLFDAWLYVDLSPTQTREAQK